MDLLSGEDGKRRLHRRLEPRGQQHVLRFWDELNSDEQRRLAADIDELDLELLERLYHESGGEQHWREQARRAQPPTAVSLRQPPALPREEARRLGEKALREGRVGMILVAGGQGSRLGFEHPKGMFPIGPVSRRSLFAILLSALRARARRHGRSIPLYLMTSPATHSETVDYFERHERFGLAPEDLRIFRQGTMPAVDAESGQLLLATKSRLFLSPDGHGGMVTAMGEQGCLRDAERRGVDLLFYCQVDNPLVQICDPELIGYHLWHRSELTTQVVRKREPLERVGNLVEIDGRLCMIEYSDLPEEVAREREADGTLRLWAGNTAVHVFERSFLERAVREPERLPWHRARKITPHLDEEGRPVNPTTPNALKFERFIFDLLPLAERGLAVEVEAAEAFAPVKNDNRRQVDTPATAQAAMVALHARWLRRAGADVADGVPVEIDPLWALDQEEVAARIVPGTVVDSPRFFEGE